MPKEIHNPISTVVSKIDGVQIVRADYGLGFSEYPEEKPIRKSAIIELNPQTLSDVDEETMEQINEIEGIS